MFTLFVRAFILYILMIFALRAMGKRQLGQFQPYELAMALLIAELLSTPMSDVSTPLLHGLLPVLGVIIVHGAITLVCMKSDRARSFISGKPSVIMSRGVIDERELNRLCLSLSDLLEGIRESGVLDPADVGCAVMEANGKITAFARAESRPPSTCEMGIDTEYEGMPLALIMDGQLQPNNLARARLAPEWLKGVLASRSLTIKGVYLATISTKGVLTIQEKGGSIIRLQAFTPGKAAW